jgi:hypothetical protein
MNRKKYDMIQDDGCGHVETVLNAVEKLCKNTLVLKRRGYSGNGISYKFQNFKGYKKEALGGSYQISPSGKTAVKETTCKTARKC